MKKLFAGLFVAVILACAIYYGCRLADAASGCPDAAPTFSVEQLTEVRVPPDVASVEKDYVGFSVSFNPARRTPNCVAWILQRDETVGESSRSNNFWTDPEVEGCPSSADYTRSGYDRGHMCPAGEQKWSLEAMHNSFVMTNICPQMHDLNSGAWKTLEDKERRWAIRDSVIVIVAGPVYSNPQPETIGRSKVHVPDAFFKVILAPFADPMRAIAFVYPNMKCPGNMEHYATTVDEVERITGLDFFSALPSDMECDVESHASFKEWNQVKNYTK